MSFGIVGDDDDEDRIDSDEDEEEETATLESSDYWKWMKLLFCMIRPFPTCDWN